MGRNQKGEAETRSGKRHQRQNVLTRQRSGFSLTFFLWCWTMSPCPGTWKKNRRECTKWSKEPVPETNQARPTGLGVFIRVAQLLACSLGKWREAPEVGYVCESSFHALDGETHQTEIQAFQACAYRLSLATSQLSPDRLLHGLRGDSLRPWARPRGHLPLQKWGRLFPVGYFLRAVLWLFHTSEAYYLSCHTLTTGFRPHHMLTSNRDSLTFGLPHWGLLWYRGGCSLGSWHSVCAHKAGGKPAFSLLRELRVLAPIQIISSCGQDNYSVDYVLSIISATNDVLIHQVRRTVSKGVG